MLRATVGNGMGVGEPCGSVIFAGPIRPVQPSFAARAELPASHAAVENQTGPVCNRSRADGWRARARRRIFGERARARHRGIEVRGDVLGAEALDKTGFLQEE